MARHEGQLTMSFAEMSATPGAHKPNLLRVVIRISRSDSDTER